jgi:hypothetical protein
VAPSAADAIADTGVDRARIETRIRELSAFGRNSDGGVDRVAYSGRIAPGESTSGPDALGRAQKHASMRPATSSAGVRAASRRSAR